jgi:hypothetical protein
MRSALRFLVLGALAASACAFEITPVGFVDLRLAYAVAHRDDIDVRGGIDDDGWDSSKRASLGVVASPGLSTIGGWLFGARVAASRNDVDDGSLSADYDTVAGHVSAGYGVQVLFIQAELMPFVGLGSATYKLDDGAGDAKDRASYLEYGADLNGILILPGGFELGLQLEWLYASSDHSVDLGAGSVSADVRQRQLLLSAVLGYRF